MRRALSGGLWYPAVDDYAHNRLARSAGANEAIRYAISRRIALERFLSDDSNIVWRCPSMGTS
jgi:hypothetical protein